MAGQLLWERINHLKREEGDRAELINAICELFWEDLPLALEKGAAEVLWESQKKLLDSVRLEYRRVATADKRSTASTNEHSFHLSTAKANCSNVLRSLYAEWTNIAVLLEDSKWSDQTSIHQLLPLEGAAPLEGDGTSTTPLLTIAEIIYTRLGDITRYMHDFSLSRAFYGSALHLNPTNGHCLAKSKSLDSVVVAKRGGGGQEEDNGE